MYSNYKINQHVGFWYLVLLFLYNFTVINGYFAVEVINTTVLTTTDYQFTFSNTILSKKDGNFTIKFPPEFKIPHNTKFTCNNFRFSTVSYTCLSNSNNQISVQHTTNDKSGLTVEVRIENITNPSSTKKVSLSTSFDYTTGSQDFGLAQVSFTASTLGECTITFNPNETHSFSEATISFNVGNFVDMGGGILLVFPQIWPHSSPSDTGPIGSPLTFTDALSNNILNSSINGTSNGDQISLANVFKNNASVNTSISFKISNILSPPTTGPGYSITLSTVNSAQYGLQTGSCVIQGIVNQQISFFETSNSTNLYVGVQNTTKLSLTTPATILVGDIFQFTARNPQTMQFTVGFTIILSDNFLILQKTMELSGGQITTNQTFQIQFIIQPAISSGDTVLEIVLFRGGYSFLNGEITLIVYPNSLSSISVTSNPSTVSANSNYTIQFQITNILSKGDVTVILPESISASNCTVNVLLINSSAAVNANLACSLSERKLKVSNISTGDIQPLTYIKLIFSNIHNSPTTKPSSNFIITTHYNQSTPTTDNSTSINITATPSLISQISISRQSQVVYQRGQLVIKYKVKTFLPANSYIKIILPSSLNISTTSICSLLITYTNDSNSSNNTLVSTINASQVTTPSLSSEDLPASTLLYISLSQVRNPPSLEPSSSLELYSYSSNDYLIEYLNTSILINNRFMNQFSDPSFSVASRKNGLQVSYNIKFKTLVPLEASDKIELNLEVTNNIDTQMKFANVSQCKINGKNNICNKQNSTFLTVVLGQALSVGVEYTMPIDSIILSRTFLTPGKITLTSYSLSTIDGNFYEVSTLENVPNHNTQSNNIRKVSLKIVTTPSQLIQTQQFIVTVQTTNPLMNGDYLIILIPQFYKNQQIPGNINETDLSSKLSQSLCQETTNYFCYYYNSASHQIKVQGLTNQTFNDQSTIEIHFKSGVYSSPNDFMFTGSQFQAKMYSPNDNNPIDITTTDTDLTSAQFYLTCGTSNHCKTCNDNLQCIDCYTIAGGYNSNSTGYYYLNNDGSCRSTCIDGSYISINTCLTCRTPCANCQSTTVCKSCLQTANNLYPYYDQTSNQCLKSCPQGYYSDLTKICVMCSNSCLNCINQPATCTQCKNGTFLNLNECVDNNSCPSSTYGNSSTNICQKCDISCSKCINSTRCISCATGYYNDIANSGITQCTNLCPIGKVNDTANNAGCTCSDRCLTCESTIDNCLSCNISTSNYILFDNTCQNVCPQGSYEINITVSTCIVCSTNNCKKCNETTCSQCLSSYYLYLNVCLTVCPSVTVLMNLNGVDQCTPCLVGCQDCSKGLSECLNCIKGYYSQGNLTNTYCVVSCSVGYINFNASVCLTACPSGYSNIQNICTLEKIPEITFAAQKIIPLPFLILFSTLSIIMILSKCILWQTILSCALCSIGGIVEVLSWTALCIVTIAENGGSIPIGLPTIGIILLILALFSNLCLNVLNYIFFAKYVLVDDKFSTIVINRSSKSFLGKCTFYTVIALSLVISHKVIQLLFCNLFGSKYLNYKVTVVNKLTPLNIVMYISVVVSVLAITGASLINYEFQGLLFTSTEFIESIDSILVTLLALIVTLWATNRNSEDYENQMQVPKQQYTQNYIMEGKNGLGCYNDELLQQSGIQYSKKGKKQPKNYYYSSSKICQKSQNDNDDPLHKKNRLSYPTKSNQKKLEDSLAFHEQSSDVLIGYQRSETHTVKKLGQNIDPLKLKSNIIIVAPAQEEEGMEEILMPIVNKKQNNQKSNQLGLQIQEQNIKQNQKSKANQVEGQTVNREIHEGRLLSQNDVMRLNSINYKLNDEEKRQLKLLNKYDKGSIEYLWSIQEQVEEAEQDQDDEKQKQLKRFEQQQEGLSERQKKKRTAIRNLIEVLRNKDIALGEYLEYRKIHQKMRDQEAQAEEIEEIIQLSPNSNSKQILNKNSEKKNMLNEQKKYNKNNENNDQNKKVHQDKNGKKRTDSKKLDDIQILYDKQSQKYEQEPNLPIMNQQQINQARYRQNQGNDYKISKVKGKGHKNRRSQETFNTKKKKMKDLVTINITGDQFENNEINNKNNQKITSSYNRTQQLNKNKDKTVNKESGNRDKISSRFDQLDSATLKSYEQEDEQEEQESYFNDISPSQFNTQNQHNSHVESSIQKIPIKPIIKTQENQSDFNNEPVIPFIQGFNKKNQLLEVANDVDYDTVLGKKVENNDRIKKLEEIYLPRMENNNKKTSIMRNSKSKGKNSRVHK